MDPRQELQPFNRFAYQTINYPILPPQQPSFSTFLPTSYQTPILYPPQTLSPHVPSGYFNFSHQPDSYSARVSEDLSYYPSDQLGFGGVKRERAPDDYSDARQGYESSDSYPTWKKPRWEEYPSDSLPRLRSTVHIRSPSPSRSFSPRKPSKQKRPSILSRLQFRKFTWKRKPDNSEDQGSVSSQLSWTKKDESLDLDISFESNVLCAREKLKFTDGDFDSKGTHDGDKKKGEANIAKNGKEVQGKETVSGNGNLVSFRIGKKGKTVASKIRSLEDQGKEIVAEKGKIEVVSTSKNNSKDMAEKIPVNSVINAAASFVEKKAVRTLVTKNRSQESQGKEKNSKKDKSEVASTSKSNSNDQVGKISVVSAVCDNVNGLNVASSVIEKKLEKTLVAKNRSLENQGKEMVSEKDRTEVVSACNTDSKDKEKKISLFPEAGSSGEGLNVSASAVDKKFEKTLVTKSRREENQKKETVAKKGKIKVVPAGKADSKDKAEKNSEALAACSTEKDLNVAGSRIETKVGKTLVTKNRIHEKQEKEMVADAYNYEVVFGCENDSEDGGENIPAVSAVCSTDKDLNVAPSGTEKVEKTVVTRSRSQGNQGKEMVADKVKIEVASASKNNSKGKVMKISAVSAGCSNDKELNVAESRTEKKLEKTVVTRSRSQQTQAKEAVTNRGKIENAATGKNSSKNTMDKNSAVSKSSSNGKEVNVAASRTGKNMEKTPVAKNRIQEDQEKKTLSGKGKVEIVSISPNDLKGEEEKISGVSAACSNEEGLNVGENVAAFVTKENLQKTLVTENRNQDNPVKEKIADKGMIEDVSTHKKDSKNKEKTKQVSKIDENVAASRTGKKLERTPVTKNCSQEDQAKDAVATNCESEISYTSKNCSIGEEKKANGVSADCSNEKVLCVGANASTSTTEEKLVKTLVTKNSIVADDGKIETLSNWKISSTDKAEKMPVVSVACSYKVETRSMIKKKLWETRITQNGIKENQGTDRVVDEGKNEVVSTCKIGSKDKAEKISSDKMLHIEKKVSTTSNEKLDKPMITKNSISEDQAQEKVVDEDNCEVFSSCKDHSKDRENEIDEVLVSSSDEKKLEVVDLYTTEKNLDTSFVSEEPSENQSVPMISDVEEGEILGKTLDRNRSNQLDSSNAPIPSRKKILQLKISSLVNRKESNDSHEVQNAEDIQTVVMTNSNVMGSAEVLIQDIIGNQSLPFSEVHDNAPKESFTKTGPCSISSVAKNVIAKVAESAISPPCDPLPTLEYNVEELPSFSLQAQDFRELLRENNAGAFSSSFRIHGLKFVQDCKKTLQNELSLVRSNRRKAYTCPIQGCREHGHCVMKPHLLIKSFGFKREIQKSIQQKNQGITFSFGMQTQPRVSLQSVQEKQRGRKKKKLMDFTAGQKKLTWKENEVNNSASPSVVRNEPSGLSKVQASPVFPTEDSPTLTLNATGESQNPSDNQDSCSLPKEAKVGSQENVTLDLGSISPIDNQDFMQDHGKNSSTLLKPKILTLIPNLEPRELNMAEDLTLETKEPDHLSSSEEEGQISCEPTNGNEGPCPTIQEKITDETSESTGSFRDPKAKDSGTSAKEPYHLSSSEEERQISWEPVNENYGPYTITLKKITDDVSRRTGFSLDPEAGNSVTLVKEPEHLSSNPISGNDGPHSISQEKITDETSRRTGPSLNPEVGSSGTSAREPDLLSSSSISCDPVNSDTGLCSVIQEKISDEVSKCTGSLLDPETEKIGTSAKELYQSYLLEEEGQISSEHIIGSDGPCPITLERLTDEASRRTGSSLNPEAGNHGTLATPLEKHSNIEKDGKNGPFHPSGRNSGISDRLFAFGIKPKQATETNTASISSRCSVTKETLTARGISGLNPTVPTILPTHQQSQLPVPFKSARPNTWRRTESTLVPAAPLNAEQHAGPLSRQSPGKWMKTPNSYVRKGNSLIRKSPNSNSEHTRKETEVKASLNSLSKRSKTPPLLGNKPNSSKPVTEEPLSLSKTNEENQIASSDNEASRVTDGLSDLATNPRKNERETPPASVAPIVSNYRRIRNKLVRDLSSSVKKASTNAYKSSRFSLVWTLNGKEPESCKGYSPLKSREVLPYLFPWKRAAYYGNVVSRSPLSPLIRKLRRLRRKNFPTINRIVRRSLRWSKSVEKQSKKETKEAESAAKEHQKKRRRTVSTVLGGKRRIASQFERIFHVGTLLYKMDPSRHSLVRIPDDQKIPVTKSRPILKEKMPIVPRRLSIDNDEYVRVGNGNQLVRDPKKLVRILASEKVRWSLHTARLRSIRKQQYCQFFTRFGKCNKEQGKCPYIHDPIKVAICSKFLKGLCFDPNCKLTHKVIPERMPDCSYFLKGTCSNSSCPYRHVNVNPGAPQCEDFLRGYCRDGNVCRKKHSYKVSRGMSGKKTVLCQKRKRVETESFRSKGRYFGGPSDDSCSPEVSLRLEKKEKEEDVFFREGRFMEFIRLGDDDDDDGSSLSKDLLIDRGFDDRDAIVKPVAIMR